MICTTCTKHVETKGDRIPKGWHRHGGVYCATCWHSRYVLRAISLPVVRPLGEGIGWPELRVALTEAWSHTTAAVNWMTSELFAADTKREPCHEKLAKQPKTYLYPRTRERFPELPSQVCAALENSTKNRYSKKRYQVLWTCEQSLPNARYPQPAISPNQAWKPSYQPAGKDGNGDKVPCVSVPLLNGQRFLLQLRGGREFFRQLAAFKQLIDGVAIKGELAIIRQRVGNDNRNGVSSRDGGGQKFQSRVMVKMVGWFPRQAAKERSGTLFVRTDSDCFAVAIDEKGGKLRIWNADHVRRWINEHQRRLNRLSDDQKAEQRPTASFQSRRESHVDKFRRRIESFTKETVAQICGVAERMKFASIRFDDSDHTYFGRFDWSGFRTRLGVKCNELGITLELASGGVAVETQEPLVETQVNEQ